MVLTEEQKQDAYPPATMEDNEIVNESIYYGNLTNTQDVRPTWFYDPMFPANDKVAKIINDGQSNFKVGPNIMLKVMAGDSYSVRVAGGWKLNGSVDDGDINDVYTELLGTLVTSLSGVSGGKITSTELNNNTNFTTDLSNFTYDQDVNADNTKPKSYLTWLLFDEQFKLVSSSSGWAQVGEEGYVTEIDVQPNLTINKNGYLYIYTSNQSKNTEVYFDNLQVTHTRGALLEETHYYPFGLTMNGISSKAAGMTENKTKYQQYELNTDFDINLYESFYRSHDPQLGRFWQVDPRPNDMESPYAAMGNNPIRNIDILGDSIRTTFYNEDGSESNVIPAQIANTFSSEYGITLGYNAETKMLYGSQVCTDANQNTVAQPLANEWLKHLGESNPTQQLFVGYDLAAITDVNKTPESVKNGVSTEGGHSIIDLADFSKNSLTPISYNFGSVPSKAFNLARIMEHEFLGHSIQKLIDYPHSINNPGPNENYLNTLKEMSNIPRRATYLNKDRSISFGNPTYTLTYDPVFRMNLKVPTFSQNITRITSNDILLNAIKVTINLSDGTRVK